MNNIIDPAGFGKDKIYKSLSQAQAKYPSLICDGKGQQRGGKADTFASLDSILSQEVRNINKELGLSIYITHGCWQDGTKIFRVTLAHESGQSIVSESEIIDNNQANKWFNWGGSNTYQIRYMVKNILGLADSDDQKDPNYEKQPESDHNTPQFQPKTFEQASEAQLKTINTISKNKGIFLTDILANYGIDDITGLSKSKASEIIGYYLGK